MRRGSRAGWVFAGPALAMLGIFFFVPVVLAFALSLTDFDLYSLADPGTTRGVSRSSIRTSQRPFARRAKSHDPSAATRLPR